MGVQQPSLPNQIESDIGERKVLLQHRPVAAPLGQPLAEDEGVVREAQEVLKWWLDIDDWGSAKDLVISDR